MQGICGLLCVWSLSRHNVQLNIPRSRDSRLGPSRCHVGCEMCRQQEYGDVITHFLLWSNSFNENHASICRERGILKLQDGALRITQMLGTVGGIQQLSLISDNSATTYITNTNTRMRSWPGARPHHQVVCLPPACPCHQVV